MKNLMGLLLASQFAFHLASAADAFSPIERQQWGLHNEGSSQNYEVDDVNSITIPGVAGEDIGLSRISGAAPKSQKKVIVAVLDTGIDLSHPDLQNRIAQKPSECAVVQKFNDCLSAAQQAWIKDPDHQSQRGTCDSLFAGIDADGDGHSLDCNGWNFTSGKFGNNNVTDLAGHGTHVAGVIAAAATAEGACGVADNVAILPVKVIATAPNDGNNTSQRAASSSYIAGFTDTLALGIDYAVANGAQVINMSMAWPADVNSPGFKKSVQNAISRGVLIVASAGNDSTEARVTPCEINGVICVAAHNPDGKLSHFSNYGSTVEVAAPGLHILSTWPQQIRNVVYTERVGYEIKHGTSMAAPFVSGILARLLSAGFSPREATARLIAGSRPFAQESNKESKFILGGNADLAQSLILTPAPLILPADKSIPRLSWDGQSSSLPFKIRLKNAWADGKNIFVRVNLIAGKLDRKEFAQIPQSNFNFSSWKADEIKDLDMTLQILDPALDGKLLAEIRIENEAGVRSFRIPLELSRLIDGSAVHGAQVFAVAGGINPNADSLRTVTAVGDASRQDYLTLETKNTGTRVQLVAQNASAYQIKAVVELPLATGNLLIADRLDGADVGSSNRYALVFSKPAPPGQLPPFHFEFLNDLFQPVYSMDYDNQTSVLRDSFQWMKSAGLMMPVWIASGVTPFVEQPPYDPWNTSTTERPQIRCYYLSYENRQGVVRSLSAPDGFTLVSLLNPSEAQKKLGVVPVLLSQGADYQLSYSTAILQDKQFLNIQPLIMNEYRFLYGLENVVDLTFINGEFGGGSAVGGQSYAGAMRATFFPNSSAVNSTSTSTSVEGVDLVERPLAITDPIIRLTGAFMSDQFHSIFSETRFNILFNDVETGQQASTTLNRFSFLPALITSKNLFPAVVNRLNTQKRYPALTTKLSLGASSGELKTAEDLASSEGVEVITPVYSEAGALLGLSRPAMFRLRAGPACLELGNPVQASVASPTAVAFFCGDRFLRIPLNY